MTFVAGRRLLVGGAYVEPGTVLDGPTVRAWPTFDALLARGDILTIASGTPSQAEIDAAFLAAEEGSELDEGSVAAKDVP